MGLVGMSSVAVNTATEYATIVPKPKATVTTWKAR